MFETTKVEVQSPDWMAGMMAAAVAAKQGSAPEQRQLQVCRFSLESSS